MKDQKPSTPFVAYADEAEVLRIGDLEIENRIDRVSLTGDLVLTKDQAGLALAMELKTVVDHIVKALEADKGLPQVVEMKPAQTVKNPFA
ncbi:MAG: hypothetical protein ABJB17_11905 [Burkholderiales bacterium]